MRAATLANSRSNGFEWRVILVRHSTKVTVQVGDLLPSAGRYVWREAQGPVTDFWSGREGDTESRSKSTPKVVSRSARVEIAEMFLISNADRLRSAVLVAIGT